MLRIKVCGPKLSLVGAILSAWGFIQLGFMAAFFYFRSIAFIEDIPGIDKDIQWKDPNEVFDAIDRGYTNNFHNCLIAALLYLVTFGISVFQFWVNSQPIQGEYENFLS